jgi:hypothetical protein
MAACTMAFRWVIRQHTQQAHCIGFVTSVQIQTVSPFNNNKELVNQTLRFELYTVFQKHFRSMQTNVEYHTMYLHFHLQNGFHMEGPNSLKAITLFIPISGTVAKTSTPKFLTDD